jgi:hypothetical protein
VAQVSLDDAAREPNAQFAGLLSKKLRWYRRFADFAMIFVPCNIVATYVVYCLSAGVVKLPELFLPSVETDALSVIGWMPLLALLSLIIFVLFCTVLEEHLNDEGRRAMYTLLSAALLCPTMLRYFFMSYVAIPMLLSLYAAYVLLCIAYRLFGRHGFRSNVSDMTESGRKLLSWQ